MYTFVTFIIFSFMWHFLNFVHYRDTRASILDPCIQGILSSKFVWVEISKIPTNAGPKLVCRLPLRILMKGMMKLSILTIQLSWSSVISNSDPVSINCGVKMAVNAVFIPKVIWRRYPGSKKRNCNKKPSSLRGKM